MGTVIGLTATDLGNIGTRFPRVLDAAGGAGDDEVRRRPADAGGASPSKTQETRRRMSHWPIAHHFPPLPDYMNEYTG